MPKGCIIIVLQYFISVLIISSAFYRMSDWSSSIAWFLVAPMLNIAKYIFLDCSLIEIVCSCFVDLFLQYQINMCVLKQARYIHDICHFFYRSKILEE